MGHWILDTAGVGSIIVWGVGLAVLAAYLYMLRWIQTVPPDPVPAEIEQADQEDDTKSEAGGQ